jgi:hypothetical protein
MISIEFVTPHFFSVSAIVVATSAAVSVPLNLSGAISIIKSSTYRDKFTAFSIKFAHTQL